MNIFLFDDTVNMVLEGTIDDWLADKANFKAFIKLDSWMLKDLRVICFELGKDDILTFEEPVSFYSPNYSYLMLYSGRNAGKIRRNILNELEYHYYSVLPNDEISPEMYHLIKNQFYDGIAARLDKALLLTDNMFSMSPMIAVAIKNRDITSLKLFLERGFLLSEEYMQYLMDKYGSYMEEHILPTMKEYEKRRRQDDN